MHVALRNKRFALDAPSHTNARTNGRRTIVKRIKAIVGKLPARGILIGVSVDACLYNTIERKTCFNIRSLPLCCFKDFERPGTVLHENKTMPFVHVDALLSHKVNLVLIITRILKELPPYERQFPGREPCRWL